MEGGGGLRMQRQEIPGPGERQRRRLMTGHEDGDDLVAHFLGAHAEAGLGVARFQKPRQQIPGPAVAGRALHQAGDDSVEAVEDARPAPAHRPRHPFRHVQQIEEARPHLDLIAADGLLDEAAYLLGVGGEHGAADDGEGEPHHLRHHVEAGARRKLVPARQHRRRRLCHQRRIGHQAAVVEGGRHDAALPSPRLAVAGEQPLAEARLQQAAGDPALHVVAGIVQEDALDAAGRVHDEIALPENAALDHRALVGLLAVCCHRAVAQRAQEAQQRQPAAEPRRRRQRRSLSESTIGDGHRSAQCASARSR